MQQKLFKLGSLEFGGEISQGKAKGARPVSTKRPLHVVMKVRPEVQLLRIGKNREVCQGLIKKWADRFKVRVFARSVNTTHLHLLIQGKDKEAIQGFLRVLPGQIAQKLQGNGKFWLNIAYSRVVQWGRHFQTALKYIEKNTLEMAGLIPYFRPASQSPKAKARGSSRSESRYDPG